MRENYLDIAEQILRFKMHRDPLIRKMVITMIPSLAAYDTQTFTEHFLHKAMGHLLTQLEKLNERNYGMHPFVLVFCRAAHPCLSFHCYRSYCHCRWKRHETFLGFHYEPHQDRFTGQGVSVCAS